MASTRGRAQTAARGASGGGHYGPSASMSSLRSQVTSRELDIISRYASRGPSGYQLARSSTQIGLGGGGVGAGPPSYGTSPYSSGYGTGFGGYGGMTSRPPARRQTVATTSSGAAAASSGGPPAAMPSHKSRRSNLFTPMKSGGWEETDMDSEALAMTSSLMSMSTQLGDSEHKKEDLIDDIEEKRLENPSEFASPDNADNWTTYEVCYWLKSKHLTRYMTKFHSQAVDGSMILFDFDEKILMSDLGVTTLHIKKVMREISKLKEAVDKRGKVETEEVLKHKIKTLQDENAKLKAQLEQQQ